MDRRTWVPLVVCAAATAVAAVVGSLSAVNAADQYGELDQPSWAPPSWLFGPVWTVLYVAIAVAGWRIWLDNGGRDRQLWFGQLVMNALWTPLFFAWEFRAFALAWILALDVLVAILICRTWRLGWPAWILTPYLAWILFATGLNGAVWWLN